VRFSNDKRPYKVHVAATVSRTGPDGEWRKMSPGMVYIHIEPEGGSRAPVVDFDPDSIDPLDPSTLPSARGITAGAAGAAKPNDRGSDRLFRLGPASSRRASGCPSGPISTPSAAPWSPTPPRISPWSRPWTKAGLELAPGDRGQEDAARLRRPWPAARSTPP
jgi:hypothetical protein